MTTTADKFRDLLRRLTPYKVLTWASSSDDDTQTPNRRVSTIEEADVISSLIEGSDNMHMVVLDIDHQAWLIKSGTPGHYHLYIEVPGGIEWEKYKQFMVGASEASIVQKGFVKASINRGHSDVRLPWKPKKVES